MNHSLHHFRKAAVLLWLLPAAAAPAANHFQSSGRYERHDTSAPVPYYINPGNWAADPNLPRIIMGIQKAFNEVSSQPHLKIAFDYRGITAALPGQKDGLSVVYLDHNHTYVPGAGITFGYEIAAEGIIKAADIALNGTTHASDPDTNLYALTLHELCHFLGLDHSSAGRDSAVYENTVNLKLSPDDLSGLAELYPNPANPLAGTTGTIRGRITTPDQSPLLARVVAWDGSKSQPRLITTLCAADGSFTLNGVPPGSCRVFAESTSRNFRHLYVDGGTALPVTAGGDFPLREVTVTDFGVDLLTDIPSHQALVHPQTGMVFRIDANYYQEKVRGIDPVSGGTLVTLDTTADDLALTPDGSVLLTVSQGSRKLQAWDALPASATFGQKLYEVADLPAQPIHVAVKDASTAYVSTNGGLAIAAVDLTLRRISRLIDTGRYNQNITLSQDGKRLWAGAFLGTNEILKVDTDPQSPSWHTVTATLPAGSSAAWIARELEGWNLLAQGTRTGVDFRRPATGELVKQLTGGRLVLDLVMVAGGTRLCFLADDDPVLRNSMLHVVDVPSLTLLEKIPAGGDFLYARPAGDGSRVIVSGEGGVAFLKPRSFGPLTPGLAPAVSQYPSAAGGGRLEVTATAPGWSALSSVPWLVVDASPHEETVSVLLFRMERNTGLNPRTAVLTAAGFSATVVQAGTGAPPVFTGDATASGVAGQPFSWDPPGRFPETVFSATGLPPGLDISPATGRITGTPAGAGSWDISVRAVNAWGAATRSLPLRISAAPLPDLVLGGLRILSVNAGEMRYEYTVRNAGTARLSGNFSLARYYSEDAVQGNDRYDYGYLHQPYDLAPGETAAVTWSHSRSTYTAASHPFLILQLSSSEVTEVTTVNNVLIFPPEGWTYALWAKYGTTFTAAQAANPVVSGPKADPDRDGVTNWMEYALGSDPINAENLSALGSSPPRPGAAGLPLPELNFLLPVPARRDVRYAVETAASPSGAWTEAAVRTPDGGWTGTATPRAGEANAEHQAWTAILPQQPGTSVFLRLRASVQP